MNKSTLRRLGAGSALSTVALMLAVPASAQTRPAAPAADEAVPEIVVTGSLFRRADKETPSPVTIISAKDLDQRGVTTIAQAIQTLSSAGGGSVPQGFINAFASGAQGVSLRGLTVDSTLVLFDGLRAAYYPLADDGQRSFVDLNTIPSAIVESVETLRDGASATYGADAIAGVVNLKIRKEIKGLEGRVEGGVAQRGFAGGQRAQLTWGTGDLAEKGWNFYVSGEYQHSGKIMARDLAFPYNTKDLSSLGGSRTTSFLAPSVSSPSSVDVAVVRPATQAVAGNILSGTAISGGLYQVIQNGGCAAKGLINHTNSLGTYCEEDLINRYTQISPDQQRLGATAHLTVNLTDDIQGYLMGTFYQSTIVQNRPPSSLRSNNPVFTYGLVLPARLSNGALNPNNPYAAAGQAAMLFYQFADIPVTLKNVSNSYRVAGGLDGSFGDKWHFTVHGTYMRTDLTQTRRGFLNLAGLTSAINDGTYNFRDPDSNSQAVRDSISPVQKSKASSQLGELQGVLTREMAQLPGGPLNVAVGGEVRYENLNDPTANPGNQFLTINAFSAVGHRTVLSPFFEVSAPVIKALELDVQGRYDHYSTGFSHFSPKFGAKFQPIRQVALRGTFAKGFRAPAIPETNGNVIGFSNYTPPAAIIAAHGGDPYVATYSLGANSVGNPNLKPETSESYTLGTVIQPVRWLSLTADYYHIKKKNVIYQTADPSYANTYMNGGTLPPGITITPNPVDPQFPGLLPTPLFVNGAYANGQSLVNTGIDINLQATFRLADNVKFTTSFDGTKMIKYNLTRADGTVYRFAGTLGPYQTTSASGNPKYRATWQNTLDVGRASITGTVYYTSGYWGYASDLSGTGSCAASFTPANTYTYNGDVSRAAGPALQCRVKSFVSVDLTGSLRVTDNFTFYVNVLNLFDAHAPFDPNTYGGNNYNPAWAASGVIGRYFQAGAKFKF